jgi:hypothetical protein
MNLGICGVCAQGQQKVLAPGLVHGHHGPIAHRHQLALGAGGQYWVVIVVGLSAKGSARMHRRHRLQTQLGKVAGLFWGGWGYGYSALGLLKRRLSY